LKNNFLFFLLTPFGFFLLIRCFFPILWCLNFLTSTNFSNQYYFLVLFHLLYLFFESLLILLFFNKINKIIENQRNIISISNNYTNIVILLLLILTLLFNLATIPLLIDGGSDALVSIGETEKFSTWFIFGIIRIILIPLLLVWYFEKNIFLRFLIFFYILIFSLLDGKKGGLIILLNDIFLIHYFFSKKKLQISFKLILILIVIIVITIFYAVLQFNRTIGLDTDFKSIIFGVTKIFDLMYNSFTSYLEQMITMNGLNYAVKYSDQLGTLGTFKYLFNSFTKIIFGYGIDQSIGPFLNYELYGSLFPNGVNPILFFELIFISGNIYFSFFSFLILYLIFHLIFKRSKKLIYAININLFDASIHLFIILFYLSLLTDVLNAIRGLPFIFILIFIKYLHKIKKI
jgi:hypothetical protein